jgi:hypothetical protein
MGTWLSKCFGFLLDQEQAPDRDPAAVPIETLATEDALALHDQIFGWHSTWSHPDAWQHFSVVLGTPSGFVAGYMKRGKPHISLAGVLPAARNQGLFLAMARAFVRNMGAQAGKRARFTISTVPDRFPVMAGWIDRHKKGPVLREGRKITAEVEITA